MKFVRFVSSDHPDGVCGLVEDGNIKVLRGSLLDPVEQTGEVVREDTIARYLPPVDPVNVLAVGRNYREHAAETDSDVPSAPLLFIMANNAVAAHGDRIIAPSVAPSQVDYDAELVVVIGRKAKKVAVENALDYVFGYTCGNDVSARDCQASDGQWARAKSFYTFAPMGPYVVTGIDPTDLRVRMRVNGETLQDQSTSDMIFSVAYLISYLSQGMTLMPGTVLFSGTPSGVGVARKPQLFLKPGDICEVDIEGIGVLRNPVAAE